MSDIHGKKKALGRGLSALLDDAETENPRKEISGEYAVEYIAQVRVDQIEDLRIMEVSGLVEASAAKDHGE